MSEPGQPFSDLGQHALDRASIRLLPEPFCRRKHVVVLGKADRAAAHQPITLGMAAPEEAATRMDIADFLQRPVEVVRLNRLEIERALDVGFAAGRAGAAAGAPDLPGVQPAGRGHAGRDRALRAAARHASATRDQVSTGAARMASQSPATRARRSRSTR